MNPQTDDAVQFLACRYLRQQADVLAGHLEGACGRDDIEHVHKVRTTTRRLRAALRLFADCFDSKRVKRWQKEFKRVLKQLGDVRDRDVQIAYLKEILQSLDKSERKIRPGIRRIKLRWQQQRDGFQSRVVKAVRRFQDSNILMDIHLETERILFILKAHEQGVQSPAMVQLAAGQIGSYQEDLLARQGCLDNPEDREGHHGLRIAAKRLRYTMEICSPVFHDSLKPLIKTLKTLQTLLGDLHDCDVWMEQIDQFAEKERQRTIDYYGTVRAFGRLTAGLDYLKEDRRKCREEIFARLRDFWGRLEADDFWQSLQQITQVKPKDLPDSNERLSVPEESWHESESAQQD